MLFLNNIPYICCIKQHFIHYDWKIMERLIKLSSKRLAGINTDFLRYLYIQINWSQRLILIKGARGTGKTTLLLQRMKMTDDKSIYLSLDDFYFESNRLVLLIEDLYEKGYRNFYLDEVHQYQHWSRDIKNLYDNYSDIKIIATGSSVLQLDKGQADLSRRAHLYTLFGLSFREYIALEFSQDFDSLDLRDILRKHTEISPELNDKVDILKEFGDYLSHGYYPFYRLDKEAYHRQLRQIIQLTMNTDIPAVEDIQYGTIRNMKKLLYVISQSVPFTPNIQSIARKISSSRNLVLKALNMLEKSSLINLLRSENIGVSYLQKPEKIYLQNTNLAFALSDDRPNKGNLRETFFYNQLQVIHEVNTSKFADFMIDKTYTFEVCGASKTDKQIQGVPQAYIASANIENGVRNKIPLWLFGFLY